MDRFDFYRTPWVTAELLKQCYRRYVTLRFDFGLARHYRDFELDLIRRARMDLWRALENPHYEIHQAHGNENLPIDLSYFLKRGVIEFIPEVSTVFDLNRTDTVIIDLDPKDPKQFSFDEIKGATAATIEAVLHSNSAFTRNVGHVAHKLRFSGNRSFHIYVKLPKPLKFEEIRPHLKSSLDVLVKMYRGLVHYEPLTKNDGSPRTDYLFIDIGALSRHRCVRSLWSIHAKTNMACVPVPELMTFDKESATIDAVLSRGPQQEIF